MYRDISGVLLGLSKEFNIKRFLAVLLDSLLLYRCVFDTVLQFSSASILLVFSLDLLSSVCSSSDDQCLETLVSIIDNVPVDNLVDHMISKVFSTCMTQYQKNKSDPTSSTSG